MTLEETYEFGDARDEALSVRPGITGWWAATDRNDSTWGSGQRQARELWRNSSVRSALPNSLRDYMDGLGRRELGDGLRLMRDQVQRSGWDATVGAMRCALESTGRIDAASVAVAAARAEGGAIEYDEPVDLGVYDAALRKAVQR